MSDSDLIFAASWQSPSDLATPPTPEQLPWLLDEHSLTQRLTELSEQQFAVQPLAEGWQVLRADECLALNVPIGSEGWVREVYLLGAGIPWVFARSVAARAELERAGVDLASLGRRSLGELLFSEWAFARGELTLCQYPPLALPAQAQHTGLWARRSCFSRASLGVLVAEVFLPAFWQRIANECAGR